MEQSLRVVITGSTRGIGYGLAQEFLDRGCRVVVSSRSEAAVSEAVSELEKHAPGRVAGISCDVTESESVDRLWEFAADRFGGVDMWINNAGLGSANRLLEDQTPDEIQRVVETNLLGTLYGCRVAIRRMRETGGTICLFEGFGSDGMTRPTMSVYGTTKRAVRYLAKSLAAEVNGTPVSVVTVSPGMVTTDLLVGDLTNRPAEERARLEKFFSILADDVRTVAPYLVSKLIARPRNGSRISWLTRGKILSRFLLAPVRIKRNRARLFPDADP